MKTATSSWIPPRRALTAAGVVLGLVLVAVAVAFVLGGPVFAASTLLGAIAIQSLAVRRVAWWELLVFGAGAGLPMAGAAATDSAAMFGIWLALSVGLTAPTALRHGAVTGMAPVVVAIAGTELSSPHPWLVVVGVLAGGVAITAVVRIVRAPRVVDEAIPTQALGATLVALALSTGAAGAAVVATGVSHGVWLVVTLAAVLVPVPRETLRGARIRVAGTVVGVAAGSVITTLAPAWLSLVIAAGAVLLGLGSQLAGRRVAFVAYVAVAVVALTSVAGGEQPVDVALQRLALTTAGALVAILLGLAVARVGRRIGGRRQ